MGKTSVAFRSAKSAFIHSFGEKLCRVDFQEKIRHTRWEYSNTSFSNEGLILSKAIMVGCDLHDRSMFLKYAVGTQEPLQASYDNDVKWRLKMTNREFHDAVLRENYVPFELLRAKKLELPLIAKQLPSWRFYPE